MTCASSLPLPASTTVQHTVLNTACRQLKEYHIGGVLSHYIYTVLKLALRQYAPLEGEKVFICEGCGRCATSCVAMGDIV
jgi:ferredoxin